MVCCIKKQRKINFSDSETTLVLLAALFFLLLAISELWVGVVFFGMLTIAAAFISPVLGLALWYIASPFEVVFTTQAGFSPYLILTPAFLGGFVLHVLTKKEIFFSKIVLLIGCLFLSAGLVSVIFSQYVQLFGVRAIVSTALLTCVAMAGVIAILNYPEKYTTLLVGAVSAALIAALYAGFQWDGSYWRMTMTRETGAGVRTLDTVLSIAIAVLLSVGIYLNRARSFDSKLCGRVNDAKLIVAVIFFSAALLMTVSRGSVVALVGATIICLLSYLVYALYTGILSKKVFYYSVIIFGALAVTIPLIEYYVTGTHIINRFEMMLSSPEENARFNIWNMALGNLEDVDWFIGVGLGSFREVAIHSPHGLYFSAIVEIGLIGLIFLFSAILLTIFYGAFVTRKAILFNFPLLFFMSFLVLSFLTKGSLYNKYFYFSFALSAAIIAMSSSGFQPGCKMKELQVKNPPDR